MASQLTRGTAGPDEDALDQKPVVSPRDQPARRSTRRTTHGSARPGSSGTVKSEPAQPPAKKKVTSAQPKKGLKPKPPQFRSKVPPGPRRKSPPIGAPPQAYSSQHGRGFSRAKDPSEHKRRGRPPKVPVEEPKG